ncbi:COQ9 family protein [Asticcacaulis sp. ZE23SCel15]|uniref:COQ9 family protein n=1 Tax=Asticcacaulis sp. ZE23SCel15 TaxID=3059027 RepID=UPI0026600A5B|nr:COQ9 family protein [Asticcacaulis sp. ZE23SCel15]WKL57514.1 COQ9 family protein [Asticcacaulis sp. ZE23SCel15]
MTTSPLKALEADLATTTAKLMPDLGLNSTSLRRAAAHIGLTPAESDLICPNGPRDIAAVLWRSHDAAWLAVVEATDMTGMKVREKISFLLTTRLDQAAVEESVTHRLFGYLMLPQHLGLLKSLVWDSADTIWRKAGDQALDENHYSKRLIVSGILTTALTTRLAQGKAAQDDQIARNIDAVMAYEKFKAKSGFKPEQTLLDIAAKLGALRFGKAKTEPAQS